MEAGPTDRGSDAESASGPPTAWILKFGLVLSLVALALAAGCLGADGGDAPAPTDPPPEAPTDEPSSGERAPDRDRTGDNATETASETDWPPVEDASVRPGIGLGVYHDPITGDRFPSCTSSFLFRSPDNSTLYLGSAAHCFTDDLDIGDPVEIGPGIGEGTLAYSSWKTLGGEEAFVGPKRYNDLALVRIPDELREQVHPAVRAWGGPTGIVEAVDPGDHLLTYGLSSYREHPGPSEQTRPAEGAAVDANATWTTAYFAPPRVWGDSGGPVLTGEGEALGVVSTWNYAAWTNRPPNEQAPSANGISNLGPALAYANEHTNLTVELVTWPLFGEPTGPGEVEQPGQSGDGASLGSPTIPSSASR